jgi:hypothetical protein
MPVTSTLNVNEAHIHFSVDCFNKTWEFIDKADGRSIEENMTMLHTAIASLWHWTQRQDVRPENLTVGYWQVSRVYCLIGQPYNARTYGLLSLKHTDGVEPFFKAYAYETLARAEMLAGNRVIMNVYLEKAHETANLIEDKENRELLLKDLETIS